MKLAAWFAFCALVGAVLGGVMARLRGDVNRYLDALDAVEFDS